MATNLAHQKIVVVEDNVALNDIYKTRLEMLGYTVFSAYDGVQALQVIEHELPDLVLLDLMVPKKAGDQILEEMRQSTWGKDIKVLIISNLNETEAPRGLRNLGIEGYAVKANLSNDQLDQLVDVILQPSGQAEEVLLSGNNHEVVSETPYHPDDVPASSTFVPKVPLPPTLEETEGFVESILGQPAPNPEPEPQTQEPAPSLEIIEEPTLVPAPEPTQASPSQLVEPTASNSMPDMQQPAATDPSSPKAPAAPDINTHPEDAAL